MYSGKDAVNPAYPTQWALNPTAYQNIDSSYVDWAALAQQWIAMKEAAAVVTAPQPPQQPQPPPKLDLEGGEAPMEVENSESNCEGVPPGAEWNPSTNSWGNSWNQWGWGWGGTDSKLPADPSMSVPPMIDGYPVPPENSAPMPGYSTGAVAAPTFQHGYWTAPQAEQTNSRSNSRNRDDRSKSKNRDIKPNRTRPQRDKIPMLPHGIDPLTMPMATTTIDAAKRRQLPGWIREGLEKMEKEKQKAIEREQEKKTREEAEKEKKKLEEEELERLKAEASGQPVLPAKSKFDSDSETEEMAKEDQPVKEPELKTQRDQSDVGEQKVEIDEKPTLIKKSREDIMQEVMFAVRRSLTEILLEVTDQEIHTVSQEELARYNAAQASHLNAMKASKSKALAAIATGLGLGAYESSSESSGDEDDQKDLSDQQLQEIIRRKRLEFERTARDIEAEVRRAELRENAEEPTTPVQTPDRPKRSRSSATPPPIENVTPEKKPERRISKDKKNNHKSVEKVDSRRLTTILEEKVKKTNKWENTPSPKIKTTSERSSSSSSSSDSDDSSSSSSDSSSQSDPEVKVVRTKKRKRRSSSISDTPKKLKKNDQKKIHKTDDRTTKSKKEESDRYDKSRSRKKDGYYDKHKSSRTNKAHKDKYRDESEDGRPRKRSKRSASYESRSGRKKVSRDRSEERSRRRDKKDRSGRNHDRSGRDYDRSGRDHDRSGRDHDRSGRVHDKHDRYDRRRSKSRSRSRHHR